MKATLPYPPSTNRIWRSFSLPGGGVKVVLTPEARRYKQEVFWRAKAAGMHVIGGPVSVSIRLIPPGKRSIDVDNAVKVTLDALEHVAYRNDKQVRRLYAEVGEPEKGRARLEVEVTELLE